MSACLFNIQGIKIGHASDPDALTGCTVILCEQGAVGGVDQRGGAPGTRETDALRPMHLVQEVHAIVLSGGSAFGLDASTGVMKYLEERGVGFDVRVAKVPIVSSAILFDLEIGSSKIRPDLEMGYLACLNAENNPVCLSGNVGAGTGATIGKIYGLQWAMKAGLGSSCIEIRPGLMVGAIVAVNALGDVIDPKTGEILGGARKIVDQTSGKQVFANTLEVMRRQASFEPLSKRSSTNTVIGVVITNATLKKEEANFVAQMAHDGLARTIRPVHTLYDGDTIFTMATGEQECDVSVIGSFAVEAVAEAVLDAVWSAKPVGGLPSVNSFKDEN